MLSIARASFLLLGMMIPVCAHHAEASDQQADKNTKPQADQLPKQQAPPPTPQQARAWQEQRGWLRQGGWKAHDNWMQDRAERWSSDHRTWAQRGGYGGYRIPQDRFKLHFGSQHIFFIGTRPVMYLGYPRFEYSGFSFLLVDPWPEYWAENWYDVDNVHIEYDDGYYLCNDSYPQVKMAIAIVL
jgi:hypothetical protein